MGISVARVITVDSTPNSQSPPSMIASILPDISSITYFALVGDGKPEVFALGAAMGQPAALITLFATSFIGIRTATVSRPPLTTLPIKSLFGKIIVSGPGKKASISACALGVTSLTKGMISSLFAI